MNYPIPGIDEKKWAELQRKADSGLGLEAALAAAAYYRDPLRWETLWNKLFELHGKNPFTLSAEDFLAPELLRAFSALAGRDIAKMLPEIVSLRLEAQFSHSAYRRSYRSRSFSFYASEIQELLCALVRFSCWEGTYPDKLFGGPVYSSDGDYILAFELRRGNKDVISTVYGAMNGDNSDKLLSRRMINAVIISGNKELIDALMKLLLAARLQEGLRQNILEAADMGSTETLKTVLKVCLDNNLFRYSSAIRAFGTWTGLGYGDAKPQKLADYAALAYNCLCNESLRLSLANSSSNTEAYFALWAQGCYEIQDTLKAVAQMLDEPLHYRKVLAWFFVSSSDSEYYRMFHASRHLDERDPELMTWISRNLVQSRAVRFAGYQHFMHTEADFAPSSALPSTIEERRELFNALNLFGEAMGSKKKVFSGNPFDFVSISMDRSNVWGCMMAVVSYDKDPQLLSELLRLSDKMASDDKYRLIAHFLHPERSREHRSFLIKCLNDRSVSVKELAVGKLCKLRLSGDELKVLAEALRTKSSGLRKDILDLMSRQPISSLHPLIAEMLSSGDEPRIQAAVELIDKFSGEHPELLGDNLAALDKLDRNSLDSQTCILLNKLLPQNEEDIQYGPENGFGLYDPGIVAEYFAKLPPPLPKQGFLSRLSGSGELLSPAKIRSIMPDSDALTELIRRMNEVFIRHANHEMEIENYDGSRKKVLFGDLQYYIPLPTETGLLSIRSPGARTEMLPFWDEFREALGDYCRDIDSFLGLYYSCINRGTELGDHHSPAPWYLQLMTMKLSSSLSMGLHRKYRYFNLCLDIILSLPSMFDPHTLFTRAFCLYRSILAIVGIDNLPKEYATPKGMSGLIFAHMLGINMSLLSKCRQLINGINLSSEDFLQWFTFEQSIENTVSSPVEAGLEIRNYLRAYSKGIIPKDVFMAFLADDKKSMPAKIHALSDKRFTARSKLLEEYPVGKELFSEFAHMAVSLEEKRGELPTPLTRHCMAMGSFEGAAHFCSLLAALGKESFHRGYEYSFNTDKKPVLSALLKKCRPAADDSPEELARLLKKYKIGDARLVEAAMYAPQWAGFAEKILGWSGLKSGVWFFHAHINESFSSEKETETALYSPISPQQFNDGAFDKNWFEDAYGKLGDKRFNMLYKCAKYITAGGNRHRRSQLYTDAILGRLDAAELRAEIAQKRNQEKLRCYPLLPIAPGDMDEALRRYEFIQKFRRESRQFGAQKRDSESKACAAALDNLAISTGLMDVNRLMWQMESRKMDSIEHLFSPVELDGITMCLSVNSKGEAELKLEKDGKTLKKAPKSLTDSPLYTELKTAAKELKELRRRSVESMEKAMCNCTWLGANEICSIMKNMVLSPLAESLLWTDGENIGFISLEGDAIRLSAMDGECFAAERLRIVHPHDLRKSGLWAEYMRLVYDRGLCQPFKQVFREYYPITEDEKAERTLSRRYAGHQIQPQRALALLKGRGWTVDYEQGLQKVLYGHDIVVKLFAMADWFSPADIEPPTLETVEFFRQGKGENVALEDVPPILFSEAMRDIDLVVSVAHAGGLDPEASHSTLEMRQAIASELLRLLKLDNVTQIGSHAKIKGNLANYSVHMGSGLVHAEGLGMISIIPVQSQSRGRVFLPFADNDPKTAEIMSKILLLADDRKIKDPSILSQLQS